MTESTRSTAVPESALSSNFEPESSHPVEVRLGSLWEIKVDDDVDSLNIDTSSEEVRTNKVSGQSIPEIVENSVSVGLLHLGVRIETRVSLFGDLSCE